jgi:hypothetical protein
MRIIVYITCHEREKEEGNQTITGNNLTTVNYHAPIPIEEDMTAHLGK